MQVPSSSDEDSDTADFSDNGSQHSTSGGPGSIGSASLAPGRRVSSTPSVSSLGGQLTAGSNGSRRQSVTGAGGSSGAGGGGGGGGGISGSSSGFSSAMASISPPDLSITSASEGDKEEKRKELLQMYVFVLRCIAYPFNATHPSDIPRRYIKVTRTNLETIRQRFISFLNGDTQIVADEAFILSVESYCDVFLSSDRITNLVKSGGCSSHDLRELFRNSIEKRVRRLPDVEGISRETVISSWLAKYDAIYRGDEDPRRSNARMNAANMDSYLSKDHLYETFQGIMDVPKYEHQILYNACQVRPTTIHTILLSLNFSFFYY